MADFEISFHRTHRFEGGFQCDKDDNGNWTGGKVGAGTLVGTKYGISAPVLMAYLKRTPTKVDMQNLSFETAKKIYRANYWNPIRGDEILFQKKADQLYDMGVNAGVGTAIKQVQEEIGVSVTHKMDDDTLHKLNNVYA